VVSAVAALAPGLLVVDNVLGIVSDVNDNGEAKRVTGPLLELTQQATEVLLPTHTGKPGPSGPAHGVDAAIGARTWSVPARVKSTLMVGPNERRQVKAHNNDAEPVTVDAFLNVVGGALVWHQKVGDSSRGQQRETRSPADEAWDELADRLVREQPSGVTSLLAVGELYAASVRRTSDTVRAALRPRAVHRGSVGADSLATARRCWWW
jgi:hypothetical protein